MKLPQNILLPITVFLVATSSTRAEDEKIRFDNFKVFRITPKTDQALETLRSFKENSNGFEFWTGVKRVGDTVDIMVPPHLKNNFRDLLKSDSFDSKVFIENVQELIDNENVGYNRTAVLAARSIDWLNYHTLEDIHDWLRELASTRPEVSLIVGGQSFEGREILGVKISYKVENEQRGVFIEGTIHAREWISGATVTWLINQILTSTNVDIRNMAENYDWYIFPVVNPDGYVYTRTVNRMWRKTRVPYPGCYGADPNRNWNFTWEVEGGASTNPCSETYKGPSPFSEPEIKSLSEYIAGVVPNLRAYISFHSYSQYLLLPYGVVDPKPVNIDQLKRIGEAGMEALRQRYGTVYETGNVVELLYVATGSSMDWVKGTHNVPITYTYELRDKGRYGFLLPANQIIETGVETVDSLIKILNDFDLELP